MATAITDQTVTVILPDVPRPRLEHLAAEHIKHQVLGPGDELIQSRIDSATITTLEAIEVQAVVIYDYWPAENAESTRHA